MASFINNGASKAVPDGIDFDTDSYVRNLKRSIEKMQSTREADVKATGIKVANWGKQYAPRKTGFMANNIVFEEGRDEKGFFMAIYCRAFYWKFVEFGTAFQSAQPFMRPAFVQGLQYLRDRLKKRG